MPTAPLTAERSALKAAIERYDAAVAHVEKVRAAKVKSWTIGGADSVEAARLVLANAKRTETTLVLSGLLNEAPPTGPSVAAAEQALAAALTTQAAVEDARTALLSAEELAGRRLSAAEAERAAAIGAVVRADPIFATIFSEYEVARQRVADLAALVALTPGKTPHEANAAQVTQREGSGRGLAQFKATLAQLTIDAAASLPLLDDLLGDDPDLAAVAAKVAA
jgi:hypothetical protein